MWFQRMWAILHIKKGTCSPMWVCDDFSNADSIEGIQLAAERISWNFIDRIMQETMRRRSIMGSNVQELPKRIYFTVKVRLSPPVKHKFYIDIG